MICLGGGGGGGGVSAAIGEFVRDTTLGVVGSATFYYFSKEKRLKSVSI